MKKKDLSKLRQKIKPSDFNPCGCDNNQLECKRCPHLHLEDMQAFLPYFISDEFPKGKSKARGQAILHVALFLDWMKHHITTK